MANRDTQLQPPLTHYSLVYCTEDEVRDTCVRPTSVMEAGKEQRASAIFYYRKSSRTGNPSSHVCCLRRSQKIMFACTGMAQEVLRGTCFTAWQCQTNSLQPRSLPMRFSIIGELKKDIRGHRFASDEECVTWKKTGSVDNPQAFSRMGLIVLSRNGINK